MAVAFGSNPVGSACVPCAAREPQRPVTWIEIKLIGEDDQPIPEEEYSVVTPDGDTVHGYLEMDGFARVDSIKVDGTCQVSFPGLDQDAWHEVG